MDVRSFRFRVVAVLAAVVTVAATLVAGTSPAAAGGGPAPPGCPGKPCADGPPGAQCAVVSVPLDYDKPRGPPSASRWPGSRRPARPASSARSSSTPAGRAAPASTWPSSASASSSGDNLDGRFDVVGFDPRGVGASDAAALLRQPGRPRRVPRAARRSSPTGPSRNGRSSPRPPSWPASAWPAAAAIARHMSTADVARDLDLLRRAVGDRKLTYLGFSYGSYLGNTTRTCSRSTSARWSSTASSTRGCGRAAGRSSPTGWRPRRSSRSSCGCATRPGRSAPSAPPAAQRPAGRRWPPASERAGDARRSPPTLRLPDRRRHVGDVRTRDLAGLRRLFLDLVADAVLGDQAARQPDRAARDRC